MSVSQFINKTVEFKFRGMVLHFDLSQGLFSSAGIDTGTKLLLKVFSRILDEDKAAGKFPPGSVLDAGCGIGVIGICAAKSGCVQVRCQDRDELARLFTIHNAAQNNIPLSILDAFTEALLAGKGLLPAAASSDTGGWDMILSNIPAKAGKPVLEDFVRQSVQLLNPGGRVIIVAVNTLADFFRKHIGIDAELLQYEQGPGHKVFTFSRKQQVKNECPQLPDNYNGSDNPPDFLTQNPSYFRTTVNAIIEEIPVQLETIHGASGFDSPGTAVLNAAKLIKNISLNHYPTDSDSPVLIHEPQQGFFPCWLLTYIPQNRPVVLCGRNILELQASRHNIASFHKGKITIVLAVDLHFNQDDLLNAACGMKFAFIAAFPDLLPAGSIPKGTDQLAVIWNSLPQLLSRNGLFLAAFSSSDAERFDRKKPSGFTRIGGIKRHGFRSLAYYYL